MQASTNIWLSPTDFVTGDPTLKISYPSVSNPSTVVTCTSPGDLKWVSIGLRLPQNVKIEEIIVCYQVSNPNSFISQIRLAEMNTPDEAIVRHDEATLLNKTDPPECHISHVGGVVPTAGTAIALALRLNFKNTNDKIMLGAVGVKIHSTEKQCVNTIAELRALSINEEASSCIELLGYHAPGDGGGGIFFWDSSFNIDLNLFPNGEDGGTVIKPNMIQPSQSGRWRRIFYGPISVRWFGAKGEETDDDTDAFSLAVRTSRVIFIPQGTYILSTLSLPTGVHLCGSDTSITTLKHKANALDHMLKPSGDFVIKNLTIDGNKSNQPAEDGTSHGIVNTIYYDGTGGKLFLAQNNLFSNSASKAIECINLSGEFRVVDNQFRDFGFEPFYSSDSSLVRLPLAIYLNYGNGGKVLISQNSFVKDISDPLGGGIMLSAQEGNYHSAIITDNYFEHIGLSNENASGAIDLYNYIHRTVITGNKFYNSTYSAIKVGNSAELVIANNVIHKDSQEKDLKASAISHPGCVRYENCGGGPWHNIVICGNVIKDWNGSFGIYVHGHMTDPTKKVQRYLISNNIIDNAKGGIELYGVQDTVLEGNIIHGTLSDTPDFSGIVILVSYGTINIRGGEIISCYPYGIIGQPYSPDEGITIIKNQADFIIQNVTFDADNSNNHIYLNGAPSVQVSNNRFKGGIPPIFLNDITNAWLYGNVADSTNPPLGVANLRDSGNFWNT